ncbi:unnamed protein product [Ambrosiozyma monospora]|uniref:Unnamed protein product n=1 Tax=Ambrosiozyma monospora TaxID=43982 RepID=A0ACB5SYZ0_AMBMO|nr:unnamed protein product [Ambrosiozyma monospora]
MIDKTNGVGDSSCEIRTSQVCVFIDSNKENVVGLEAGNKLRSDTSRYLIIDIIVNLFILFDTNLALQHIRSPQFCETQHYPQSSIIIDINIMSDLQTVSADKSDDPSSAESQQQQKTQLSTLSNSTSTGTTTGTTPATNKRTRFACQRCRKRKRRCDGIPNVKPCSSCLKAKENCSILFNRQDDQKYIKSLEDKIKYLEEIISDAKSNKSNTALTKTPVLSHSPTRQISASPNPQQPVDDNLEDDIVRGTSYLTFGKPSEFLSTIAGFNLSFLLKTTLRKSRLQGKDDNFSLRSPPFSASSSPLSSNNEDDSSRRKKRRLSVNKKEGWKDLIENEELCHTLVSTFIENQYSRFPVIPKQRLFELNADRNRLLTQAVHDRDTSVNRFILLMVYAIALRLFSIAGWKKTVQKQPYASEDLYDEAMKSLNCVTSEIDTSSVICLLLVALYTMRSANPLPVWHLMSFIVRFCIELGMNRKEIQPVCKENLFETVERRRLFWHVYLLERAICFHTGRPFSISDSDIDVELPFNIDSDIVDNDKLYELIYEKPELMDTKTVITDMSMAICNIEIRRLDSLVQHSIYRVDSELSSHNLLTEIRKKNNRLNLWQAGLPQFEDLNSQLFITLMYNRSKRILLVPLLSRDFEGDNKHIANMFIEECVQACGTLCLISKKLIQLEVMLHCIICDC